MTVEPEPRHLADAYAWHVKLFTERAWPEGSWQAVKLADLYRLRFDHPEVRQQAKNAALQEAIQARIFELAGGAREQKRVQDGGGPFTPPNEGEFRRFVKWIDKGAVPEDHSGWSPSALLLLLCGTMLNRDGRRLYQWAITKARDRWIEGFFPDPFTKTPRVRAA